MSFPRILSVGEAALSIEFGDQINDALNAQVHELEGALTASPLPGQRETVPSYRSLLVVFDPVGVDLAAARSRLAALAMELPSSANAGRSWRVPVLYGGVEGPDLDAIAAWCGVGAKDYAAQHASGRYRVHMIGFQPGFCYLGGLDPALAMPRRAEPRIRIPARSISVGGVQTAIGTVAGPSGWHVIGRTPVRPFDPTRDPVFLFGPGDMITFRAVEPGEWDDLDAEAKAGGLVAQQL